MSTAEPPADELADDERPPEDDVPRPGPVKLVVGFVCLLGSVALAGASLAGSFWLFANDVWGGLSLFVAIPTHVPTIALYNQALTAPPNASFFGIPRWLWVTLLTVLYLGGAVLAIAARMQ